jgi:Flp pilus assembly secretin CpaC
MFARKIMAAMVAIAVGLTGFAFVLAEDPTPIPNPTPAVDPQPPVVRPAPQPSSPIQPPRGAEGKEPAHSPPMDIVPPAAPVNPNLKPTEPQVQIDVMCVQVPEGFATESGLTANQSTHKVEDLITCLNPRETKMLNALLRATPGKQVLALPRLTVEDGQTGYISTGGPVEEVAVLEATTRADGKTDYTPKTVRFTASHLAIKVTPKISKDKGNIMLRVDAETANASEVGTTVNKVERDDNGKTIQTPTIGPGINVGTVQTTVVLPDGGTAVLANSIESARDKTKKTELLWIVTPHLVRSKP